MNIAVKDPDQRKKIALAIQLVVGNYRGVRAVQASEPANKDKVSIVVTTDKGTWCGQVQHGSDDSLNSNMATLLSWLRA